MELVSRHIIRLFPAPPSADHALCLQDIFAFRLPRVNAAAMGLVSRYKLLTELIFGYRIALIVFDRARFSQNVLTLRPIAVIINEE